MWKQAWEGVCRWSVPWPDAPRGLRERAWEYLEGEGANGKQRKWPAAGLALALALALFAGVGSAGQANSTWWLALAGLGVPSALVGTVVVYLAAREARERYKWMMDIAARFAISWGTRGKAATPVTLIEE